MNSEEEKAIQQDKQNHPDCSYSVSSSKSCSTTNEGRFVCDTLREILRHCQGEKSKVVSSKTITGKEEDNSYDPWASNNGEKRYNGIFGSFMDRGFEGAKRGVTPVDPFSAMNDIMDELSEAMMRPRLPGSFFNNDPTDQYMPFKSFQNQNQDPDTPFQSRDHSLYIPPHKRNNKNNFPEGEIVGRIEEI